jgi:hypothetical protein
MNIKPGKMKKGIFTAVILSIALVVAIFAIIRLDVTGRRGSGLSEDYVYNLRDVGKIDPNLFLYKKAAEPINTGFKQAFAVLADAKGTIYVTGDESLRLFDRSGTLKREIKTPPSPRCFSLSTDGKIYVGTQEKLIVLDSNFRELAAWPLLNKKSILTSIAVSKNDVFAADAGNRVVLLYDTSGKIVKQIGKKDESKNIPGFVIPSPYFDLAIGKDGLLRVVNPGKHRIEAYTFDGDLEFWWGKASPDIEGFCGCCNPVNFAILPDDSFVTSEKGLLRVKIYSPDGKFAGVAAGPEQLAKDIMEGICNDPAKCQKGGFDVAVDNEQRILVLDTVHNVVRTFSKIKTQ